MWLGGVVVCISAGGGADWRRGHKLQIRFAWVVSTGVGFGLGAFHTHNRLLLQSSKGTLPAHHGDFAKEAERPHRG